MLEPSPELTGEKQLQIEIEQAEQLLQGGQNRAAGAIAGVVLEALLKELCEQYEISYASNAGLQLLIQALLDENVITFDKSKLLRRLAAIRNKCAHAGQVSENEIRFLVTEVKQFVAWVASEEQ